MGNRIRPVMCVCEKEMRFFSSYHGGSRWGGWYSCKCGWQSPVKYGATEAEVKEAAYLAATCTSQPPDKDICWPSEPLDAYKDQIATMSSLSCEERLQFIRDIVVDYDGYRTAKGLATLLNEVYAIAGSRPENLPLTREQIAEMPDLAAVWEVSESGSLRIDFAGLMKSFARDDAAYFSAPPTPADIEAARKEQPM